ncbi:MAG: LamG domain-containing protein [Chlorobi bacterium]|nr:LamG domain-containing protein [Chlorobiota bacterium]
MRFIRIKFLTAFFGSFVLCFYSNSICYSQLVASYPFTSGQALDVSGNGLHGAVVNAVPACDRFSNPNSAMFFNGSAYITIPHSDKLSFGNRGFTLCAWIKFCQRVGDYAGIISKGPEKIFYPGYQLTITGQGRITTQIGDSTGYGIERRGSTLLNDGKWHFVVLVVGASNSTLLVNLYVDGKLESYGQKYTPRGGLDASLHYTEPLFIGKERNSEVSFRGTIDDVEMYNQPLTQQQIISMYSRNNWPVKNPISFIEGTDTIVICNGQSTSLVARKIICYEDYQWSTGEKQQTISVNMAGTYIIQATDINGCIDRDTVVVVECERADGLIAYYPFNNNAYDSTLNRLNGVVKGAVSVCDRFDQPHSAYAFDGKSSIEIPHNPKLAFGASNFSICAWVKFCQPLSDYAGIVCKGPIDVFYPGYQLTVAGRNKLTTQVGDSSGYGIEQRGNSNLDDNKWHFVVLIVSPVRKNNQYITMYVDGKLEKNSTVYSPQSGLNASLGNESPLYIGKERNSKVFFKGFIDDVRIYQGSISDSLIQTLYRENSWNNDNSDLTINIEGKTVLCPNDSTIINSSGCYARWLWSTGDTTSSIIVRKSGVYTLTVTDYTGCQTSKAIAITDGEGGLLKTNLSKAYKVYPGTSQTIALTLESNIDRFKINQFDLEMQYDRGVVQFEKIEIKNSLLDKWKISIVKQGGEECKAIFQAPDNMAIKGEGVLAYITFKTHIGDTLSSLIPYKITPIIQGCDIQTQIDPGFISIDSSLCGIKFRLIEAIDQKTILSNLSFNKKDNSIEFKLHNPMEQQISINLYDMNGCLVCTILNEYVLKGEHRLLKKISDLSSGIYCLVLNTETQRSSTLITN